MDDNHWPSEWQRGVLDLCVLHILADGPTYGYSIAARLTDAGFADVKGGTLYPLLKRLEGAGLVDVEWRPCHASLVRHINRLLRRIAPGRHIHLC